MRIDTNPFIVSGRIQSQYFCGRSAESARLIKLLVNGNNVVLKSDRRVGKTGLIQYCFDQPALSQRYYTFFVDILHTTCLQELVRELGKAVYEQTVPHGKKMVQQFIKAIRSLSGKMGVDVSTGLPTFTLGLGDIEHPEYTLDEIFRYLQQADLPCIVAIDEFQQIGQYPEKNVEALLRGHIQKIDNCKFVFAGSEKHMLGRMFDSRNRPFYKSADSMVLEAIERSEYVSFICRMFVQCDRSIDTTLAEKVYDMFEGHTYYVQKTMNEAFANTSLGECCTDETIQTSLQAILDGNDMFYREVLSRMSLSQKMLLYAIAAEGKAKQLTSAAFIKRHKLASASSVQSAAKKLLANEMIVEEAKQCRVSDRFLSLWILRLLS